MTLPSRISAILRSGPPRAGISSIAVPPEISRRNAMKRPSGDHTGLESLAGPLVSCNGGPPVPISFTYMCDLLPIPSELVNATWLPSGEKLGSYSKPGRAVSGTDVKAGVEDLADERTNLRTPAPSPIPKSRATAKGNHLQR